MNESDNRWKIAQVITRSDAIGGAQVHVRDLCLLLRSTGHEPHVLVGGDGCFINELRDHGIAVHPVRHLARPIHPLHDMTAWREIIFILRRLRPDIVATHTAKAGWLGRAAASRLNLPSIFTPHGWSVVDRASQKHQFHHILAERIASRFTSQIINVCDYERELALSARLAKSDRLQIVHNGMPEISSALIANAVFHPPRIVMVARFEKQKDHRTLLHALVPLKHLDWTLDFVGEGALLHSVRKLASTLGLENRVQFLGHTDRIAAILAESQIFVLISNFEAFPLTIIEAMRAQLPVIATSVGGVKEAVDDKLTGFLVPHADVQQLSQRLKTLITNPELRGRMGQTGRNRYLARFTSAAMLDKTLAVYGAALFEHHATRSKPSRLGVSGIAVATSKRES